MEPIALLAELQKQYLAWGIVFAILTCFELLNPREDHGLKTRLTGLGFWAVSVLFSFVAGVMLARAWAALGVRPLFAVPAVEPMIGSAMLGIIIAALLSAVIHDFFFYWFHRIQHRWLWRWHAVHHSIERLNAVNSFHHPSEAFMSMLLMQVPLSLLVGASGSSSAIVSLFLWCHLVWIHSPTRITLGPLRLLLVDNRFHRIHHSLETRHFDKNFGAFTTIWDRLFGTCHMPASDEWPAVGIAQARHPRGFGEWMAMPWRLSAPVAASVPPVDTIAPEVRPLEQVEAAIA